VKFLTFLGGSYAVDCETFTVHSKTFLVWSAWDQNVGSELSSFFQSYVVH
jgi:hypothetical protein